MNKEEEGEVETVRMIRGNGPPCQEVYRMAAAVVKSERTGKRDSRRADAASSVQEGAGGRCDHSAEEVTSLRLA